MSPESILRGMGADGRDLERNNTNTNNRDYHTENKNKTSKRNLFLGEKSR